MRILHTADWHFGRTLEGRSRQEEQEAFVDELVAIAEAEGIDLVLMAGDVYDTVNPPSQSEKLFYDSLSRLAAGGKRHVVVIAGNHDNPERLAAAGPLAGKQGITLIGLPVSALQEVGIARTQEKARILALPYPSESRLKELLASEADEAQVQGAYADRIRSIVAKQCASFTDQTVNLIMSHLFVYGGDTSDSERPIHQLGTAYAVDTSALCAGAQYVALGHLHRPQMLTAPDKIRYSGSPLSYSFSERGQAKSVTIVDLSPGKPAELKEVVLSSGRPLVRWEAKGGIAEVYRWLDEGKDARAWIDLELHLTEMLSMEQIQILRKQHGGIVNIRPVYPLDEQEAELSYSEKLPIDEMFRRFYAQMSKGAQPEPELVQLFMQLLEEASDDPDAVESSAESAEVWRSREALSQSAKEAAAGREE
ncbi:exonuclease SbcCD subunit D [Gorillibacterium massiliense]|uniref:exonuclease SbcCD subunit D n=1 Tax=Gorillibacterium massiliense TaxID=1280390 RepID=UPI0004AD7E81|nr:exonuclease SbcCD subunit D [Gorillibacterium massiliense]